MLHQSIMKQDKSLIESIKKKNKQKQNSIQKRLKNQSPSLMNSSSDGGGSSCERPLKNNNIQRSSLQRRSNNVSLITSDLQK
jgi:hypothetical protein